MELPLTISAHLMFPASNAGCQHWRTSGTHSVTVAQQEETSSPASDPAVGPLGYQLLLMF